VPPSALTPPSPLLAPPISAVLMPPISSAPAPPSPGAPMDGLWDYVWCTTMVTDSLLTLSLSTVLQVWCTTMVTDSFWFSTTGTHRTVLILYSYTVLILHSYCTHTVLILYSYCTHTNTHTVLSYSYCTHTMPTCQVPPTCFGRIRSTGHSSRTTARPPGELSPGAPTNTTTTLLHFRCCTSVITNSTPHSNAPFLRPGETS
jgi:hypothetical protein